MSATLFVYLDSSPGLEPMRQLLNVLGLNYKHTLSADERWDYPMHVFGCDDLRVVYHAGKAERGDSLLDSRVVRSGDSAEVRLQLVSSAVARHFGGMVYDPKLGQRSALLDESMLARER